ncbi:uncharacterized protein LOC126834697 [Adelges cooleyi]|uniref:uncharacterized protein LOC126834697 n=1 Tax=Adelges cooleyi TaxID=133065 RepID=UPI0021800924|nr:uncharacterized protein LOC126834697 [Adelges cooleyi]
MVSKVQVFVLLCCAVTAIVSSSISPKNIQYSNASDSGRSSNNFRSNRLTRGAKHQSMSKKQNRLLSLFTIVQFENQPCYSSSGDSGICMTSAECHQHLGVPIGSCANSYGVCCLSLTTCGQTIRENGTYFVNAGYPDGLNDTGTCQVTLHKASPFICQFRLDFERFVISGPEPINHQCDNDQFIVSGSNPVPVICGMNTGSHMYVDAGTGTSPIILTMVTSGVQLKRNWKIKVSQIACDSTTKADTGCLQYYTGISGTVRSYNYEPYSGLHLSNQDYTICLRTERNFCSVQYTACDDQMNNRSHAFTLTGNTLGQNAVQANVGSVGSSPCNSDYLVIPCVSNKQGPVASGMNTCVDRLCGGTLSTDYTTIPTAIISNVRPFRLSFHTNGVEMPNDMGNRGFCLNYIQQPCNANYP